MVETFFTSDTHFGHNNIIKFCERPFETSEEMDAVIIERWNSLVSSKDEVFHLGDFSFRSKKETNNIVSKLNGNITLIRGNHDLKRIKLTSVLGFREIKDYHELNQKRYGQKIVLFHFPILSWNKKHHGSIHCHGHTHSLEKSYGKRINVGVDSNDFYPYHIEEIFIMSNKADGDDE
jgi:calcineurin-like phosphoesterase family protein